MKVTPTHVFFDEMGWPRAAGEHISELEWRLRHNHEGVKPVDMMHAASVIAAYRRMVFDPRAKRQRVIRALRAAERAVSDRGQRDKEADAEESSHCQTPWRARY